MTGQKLGRRAACALCEAIEPRVLLSGMFAAGSQSDIAYDSSGNLHVAYYESTSDTTGKLMYVKRTSAGIWQTPLVLDDSSANMGHYPSLEIANNGRPGVAYYDASNADLKYRHFNGTAWETAETIPDNNSFGRYPSLAYSPTTNRPVISYYHVNQSSLKVAKRGTSGWDAANISIADNTGNVGRYSVLKFNPGLGRWSIAYTEAPEGTQVNSYMKYVEETQSGWGTPIDLETSATTSYIYLDMAFCGNDPAISYYDSAGADLRYARRTGSTWATERVGGASGKRGMYSSLWFNTSVSPARPVIVHYNESADRADLAEKINGTWNMDPPLYKGGGRAGRATKAPNGRVTHSWTSNSADGLSNLFITDSDEGTDWTQSTVTTSPSGTTFPGRYYHSAFVTGGATPKMWITGGHTFTSAGALGDIWWSSNGSTWNKATDAAGFGRRYGHATVVDPSGTIWMTGGVSPDVSTNNGYSNQVFSSTDGLNWTEVVTSGSTFSPRYNHASVWFNNRLWVMGGYTADDLPGGVWSSADGATWTQETQETPYGHVEGFSAVVFDDKIWVLGGDGYNNPNIYWSSDGRNWNVIGASQSANLFSPRSDLAATVFDGRIWLIGGHNANGGNSAATNEVWSSVDGINWVSAGLGEFSVRTGHAAVGFAGKLWVLQGLGSTTSLSDVWSTN